MQFSLSPVDENTTPDALTRADIARARDAAPNIVALDLSLTRTGIAVALRDDDIEVGTLATKLAGPARLVYLREAVLAVAASADVVCLEGYSFNSRARGEQLGELGGVIRVALYEREIPWVAVAPAKLKQYATSVGNASKEQVLASGVKRSGIEFRCSDECDAYWLLQMALAHYRTEHPRFVVMPASHQKALRSIEWPDIIERTRT